MVEGEKAENESAPKKGILKKEENHRHFKADNCPC